MLFPNRFISSAPFVYRSEKIIYLLEQSFEIWPAKARCKELILRFSHSRDNSYCCRWWNYNTRYLRDYITSSSESTASSGLPTRPNGVTIHQTAVRITHCLFPKRKVFTSTRITQHRVIAKCGLWFTHDHFFAQDRFFFQHCTAWERARPWKWEGLKDDQSPDIHTTSLRLTVTTQFCNSAF
jgi:hypothetical protein